MIPALFAEDDEPEAVEVGQKEELFAVHMRASGDDCAVISHGEGLLLGVRWSFAGNPQRKLWPRAEAERVMEDVRQRFMNPGGEAYSPRYSDLRLVGERSGDVRDPELLD